MKLIEWFGGRKSVLGFVFLGCSTFLVALEAQKVTADYVGMSTVVGAIAAGVFGLVWGNVQEHKAQKTNGGEQ